MKYRKMISVVLSLGLVVSMTATALAGDSRPVPTDGTDYSLVDPEPIFRMLPGGRVFTGGREATAEQIAERKAQPERVFSRPVPIDIHRQASVNDKEAQKVSVNFDSLISYTTLLDDSYVYLGTDETDFSFYRTFFTGETVSLGGVPNFYIKMKQSVLKYPELFVFISQSSNDTQEVENTLVNINLSGNTFKEYKNNDGSIAGLPTYSFNGGIITLKNKVDSTSITTFIERVDTEKNNWENIITCELDTTTNEGEAIFGLCSDEENMYILYDVCSGKGNVESFLKVFDKNLKEIKSIRMNDEIHDYVMISHISNMQVFGNYIYIYNASNYGFLGHIKDNKLEEVFSGRNFELAQNHTFNNPIFYIRRTNSAYIFEKDKLIEKKLNIGNSYSLMTMLSNENMVFVTCYANEKENFAYLLDRDDLADAIFPCQ